MSNETKPLSYYLKNGLWYFTQPPDPISGQVIPQSTVESWLKQAEAMEAERTKLMAVLQVCADALNKSQYVILRMADGPNREAWGPQLDTNDDALSQLKSIGIEPNHPPHPAGDN